MTHREKELYDALKVVADYLSSILSMTPDAAIDSLVNHGLGVEEHVQKILYKE